MFSTKYFPSIAIAFIAVSAGAQQPSSTTPMEPSKTVELFMSNNDKTFMTSAASGGQFEIQASRLALEKATNPKLKTFAQKMVDDHSKANDDLTALASKKNVTLPAELGTVDQAMLDSLSKKDAGKSFDNAYRMEMRASHKKAISPFDNEARNGKDPEVKSWTAETLPTLKKHGGMANGLPKAS